MLACGTVLMSGAAWIFTPAATLAVPRPQVFSDAITRAHAQFARTLAGMIGGSVEVLAIHPQGESSNNDILLWLRDDRNPGVIDADELAIVSQSRLFRTITVYTMPVPRGDRQSGESIASTEGLDRATMSEPAFSESWRALPNVQRQVIAREISDMTVVRENGDGDPGQRLALSLRWVADSTDVSDEASATIDVQMRRQGRQE